MKEILLKSKIVVCVGSGGVGKTTVAAALGVWAAKLGLKTLVLTIDPSKRLASTLGIDSDADIVQVPNSEKYGKLYAGLIQHKKIFDDFVLKAAEKTPGAEKILDNPLYKQLSTQLSGSQEFTALEKLYSVYKENKFDLIVLDTPPAQHAIDFLRAPQKLAALFNEKISQWFRDPKGKDSSFWKNMLQAGTRQVFKVLESVTGSEFLAHLSLFFQQIHGWQNKLEERTVEAHKMLVSPQCSFVLVTSFDQAKMLEAEYFAQEIRIGGYHLKSVILNRAYPKWLQGPAEGILPEHQALFGEFKKTFEQKQKDFANFKKSFPAEYHMIPESGEPVSDLEALAQLVEIFEQSEKL